MDPGGFLQWLFQRFTGGQACPHSSHLGRCLPPKPALERITNPHVWLTFKTFSWPWPMRIVVIPWPALCPCRLTLFPERWKKVSGPGSHVASLGPLFHSVNPFSEAKVS